MQITLLTRSWLKRLPIALAGCALAFGSLAHDGPHPAKASKVSTASSAISASAASDAIAVKRQPNVRIPDVGVIDSAGRPQRLAQSMDTPEALLVNFVFTTCSTICSTQTAVLAEFQRRLLADGRRARFVTVTIDPDNDTPERLAAFARQFDIQQDWSFFTGEFSDLVKIQQAFDVYRGSKASHPPVVMLKRPNESSWVRIEGMAAPTDLLAVFDQGVRRR